MQTYMSFYVSNKTSYVDEKAGKQVNKDCFNLRFIDSFGFMASSLSQLVVDLKKTVSINSKTFRKNLVLIQNK